MFQQSSDYISRLITTHGQMRRLPHQGARHGTVDHGDAPLVGASFELGDLPPEISLLSLARGWPLGANSSWFHEWRCLQGFRVENPSGARKGAEPTPEVGQAGRLGSTGPGPSRPGSVAPSLPWVLM
jgi:hypothetical protein